VRSSLRAVAGVNHQVGGLVAKDLPEIVRRRLHCAPTQFDQPVAADQPGNCGLEPHVYSEPDAFDFYRVPLRGK
jgi:hypothetical protein